jgi:hypothetical protein
MPKIDRSIEKIEIGIKIKLKNGEEISFDYDEGKNLYNQLRDIYDKWTIYPIGNLIMTAPINSPSRYYELTCNGISKITTT